MNYTFKIKPVRNYIFGMRFLYDFSQLSKCHVDCWGPTKGQVIHTSIEQACSL